MKKIFLILLVSAFAFTSCKNRKEQKQAEAATESVQEVTETTKPATEEAPNEVRALTDEERAQMTLVSMSKSVCFGACPSFDFNVYANGMAIYHGKENVEMKGKYKAQISAREINELLNEASAMDYFSLNDKYDNENVSDLPSTTTYLNFNGKGKKVLCRFNCDDRLKKVNKMIESMIKRANWKQYEE